jgi:phospholipid transport system substrate-binding protein
MGGTMARPAIGDKRIARAGSGETLVASRCLGWERIALMRPILLPPCAFVALFLASPARAGEDVEKPIKTFISAIRYGKEDLARKLIDGDTQARMLTGPAWEQGTAEQRAELISLFQVVFQGIAFPKLKENFQKIETIVYARPRIDKDTAEIDSTLVVLHPMKKQEIKVHYLLSKSKAGYKLVDVTFAGDKSMLTNIRDEQVSPLLAEGGWPKLIEALRERAREIQAKGTK